MPMYNGVNYADTTAGQIKAMQAASQARIDAASGATPSTGAYGKVGQNFEGDTGWYTRNAPNKVFAGEQLNPEYNQGLGLQQKIGNAYTQSLANPQQNAQMYGSFFQQAGNAIAQPALQDFNQELAGVQGNTAARFGGNASTEEQRNVYNTSNLFSRNLANSLAALAPQQISAGQAYTNQLGQAYGQASANQAALRNSILSGLSPGANTQYVDPSSQVLPALIGAVGGAAAAAAGKPPTP